MSSRHLTAAEGKPWVYLGILSLTVACTLVYPPGSDRESDTTPSPCFLLYDILTMHPGYPWPLYTPTVLSQGPLHPTWGTGELERNYMAVLGMLNLSLLGRVRYKLENWEGSYIQGLYYQHLEKSQFHHSYNCKNKSIK